jgi:hypothetical protein
MSIFSVHPNVWRLLQMSLTVAIEITERLVNGTFSGPAGTAPYGKKGD